MRGLLIIFKRIIFTAACAFCFSGINSVLAETNQTDLIEQFNTMNRGQDAILKELREIRALLQQQGKGAEPSGPNPKSIYLNLAGRPVQGNAKAPVTLVEFSDFQCPFCGKFHKDVLPQINAMYIQTGKVRRVSIDLPLDSIHPHAFAAAQATRCALERDKYFEFQEVLYGSQQTLDRWAQHAATVGLDSAWLTECIMSARHAEGVRRDIALANGAGIRSTPTFLIARTDPQDSSKIIGVALIVGAKTFDAFKNEIDKALSEK